MNIWLEERKAQTNYWRREWSWKNANLISSNWGLSCRKSSIVSSDGKLWSHRLGTFLWTQPMSGIFIWSLGSALAGALLGTSNIIRVGRRDDKTLAAVTMVGTACSALVAFGFGVSIHNPLDPRPFGHVMISTVLVIFSVGHSLAQT